MDLAEILQYLPHRFPFLMVDRVISCEPGKRLVALKNVSINEPFFQGHFPHHPVMPGVLVIEAMAQASAILSYKTVDKRPDDTSVVYFVGIDSARFKKPVFVGDQLIIYSELQRRARGFWKFSTQAKVNEALVAEAELISMEKLL
jgi:3-hydroxyacyl-[acyl-carrier-protein] dehydratase